MLYIIVTLPYLAEDKTLPNLPHLVIVPGTLLSQWEAELRTLFNPKFFKILMYTPGKALREDFWSEDGPFYSTRQKLASNVIIIASHSVS
jgi:SNF2 family DNA or RNA helicase